MKIRRLPVLLILLVALSVGAWTAGESAPGEVAREVLENGLTVITQEIPDSRTVSLNIFVRAGSMFESEQTNGISHFYEHLFFRGTPKRTGAQMKKEIEEIGGSCNAETSRDMIHFYINLPAPYARQGLEILADSLVNADFKDSEIEQERKVVLDEYRITQESPASTIHSYLYSLAFKRHPYRMPVIGTEGNLKRFSPEDFRQYKSTFYVPQNCIVVVVGNFSRDSLMGDIRDAFSNFRTHDFSLPTYEEEEFLSTSREQVILREMRTTYVILAFRAPSVKDRPDIYAMDVLTFMLGQGRGSMLKREMVDKSGLALEASVDFLTQRCRGLTIFSAVMLKERSAEAKAALLKVIEDVQGGKFSAEELARAKTLLVSTYTFGNETNSGKANTLGFYETIDDSAFAGSYVENIRKVTSEDVVAAARRYLGKSYVCVIMKPRGKAR